METNGINCDGWQSALGLLRMNLKEQIENFSLDQSEEIDKEEKDGAEEISLIINMLDSREKGENHK